MELLMAYDWPGNVRELENTMERMTHMAQDEVLDVDLVPANILAGGQSGMASGRARGLLSLQEKEILLRGAARQRRQSARRRPRAGHFAQRAVCQAEAFRHFAG